MWGTPVVLDVGNEGSLQIVNGNPAISYYARFNGDLKYIRATNASGTAWGAPISLDVAGDVGGENSLQIVAGNPAISYNDVTNGDLKYIRANDASGTTWGTPATLDASEITGQQTSMIGTASGAAIAYYNLSQSLPYFVSTAGFTLPVTLTNVKAYQKNGGVQVEWRTQQEINIDYYEVERSQNAIDFSSKGRVSAVGISTLYQYALFDPKPYSGISFYRIKINDKSGKVSYSAIMKISIGKQAETFTFYPNPFLGNAISLQLNNLPKGTYLITLLNNTGQQVAVKILEYAGGSLTEIMEFSKTIAAGSYQLILSGGGVKEIKQVVKR